MDTTRYQIEVIEKHLEPFNKSPELAVLLNDQTLNQVHTSFTMTSTALNIMKINPTQGQSDTVEQCLLYMAGDLCLLAMGSCDQTRFSVYENNLGKALEALLTLKKELGWSSILSIVKSEGE